MARRAGCLSAVGSPGCVRLYVRTPVDTTRSPRRRLTPPLLFRESMFAVFLSDFLRDNQTLEAWSSGKPAPSSQGLRYHPRADGPCRWVRHRVPGGYEPRAEWDGRQGEPANNGERGAGDGEHLQHSGVLRPLFVRRGCVSTLVNDASTPREYQACYVQSGLATFRS